MKKFFRFLAAIFCAVCIVVLASGIAWFMYGGARKLPIKQYFSRSYTNAVWDWSSPLQKNQSDLRELSNYMYLHQLNTVYVNTAAYAGSDKDAIKELDDAMYPYIQTLKKQGVAVFAMGGDVAWSNRNEWKKPRTLLQSVYAYNQAHPDAPFAGVEFDIEAYNQTGFAEGSITTKTLVLTDFLDLADQLVTDVESRNKDAANKLELGFAIPYWYDNQNGNIPSITWKNKTGPTLYHLLDRLNALPKSNVVVMAYRNAARGNDGVIAHSRTEVEYAQSKAQNVSIIIGQEVGDVEPAKITYYGQSMTELSSQVKAIEEGFKNTIVMQGIAINDLTSLREMEE